MVVLPVELEYLPNSQKKHLELPSTSLYVPVGHGWQLLLNKVYPGSHAQSEAFMLPSGEVEYSWHEMHVVAFQDGW
jgi:hypothetical protein